MEMLCDTLHRYMLHYSLRLKNPISLLFQTFIMGTEQHV